MTTNKRPTIRDVAAEAGVSKSLVSLVFTSQEGVSPERREKVLAAAKKLGFTPNQWARSLRSGSGQFVAILVADFHNPMFTEVADIVRRILAERGIFCFVTTAVTIEKDGKKTLDPVPIQSLLDLKPKSLLVVGGLPDHAPLRRVAANLPIVVALAGVRDLVDAITIRGDDVEAMRLLIDHLTKQGHERIAYMGPDDSPVATFRMDAYRRAMKAQKLTKFIQIQSTDRTEPGGYAAAKLLLQDSNRPTALIGFNDNVALGAQDAADQFVQAGEPAVAVTGYDNTYIAQLGKISLTSIEQEKEVVAQKVCELLTNEDEFDRNRGTEILLLPRLYIRNSSLVPVQKK